MPDPTPAVEAPRRVETDLSKALVAEQSAPAEPETPRRPKGPPPAPTDGSERLRDIGSVVKEEREFLETLYKELDGMRIENADTRRLKWVVQALVKRFLDSFPASPPAAPSTPAKP